MSQIDNDIGAIKSISKADIDEFKDKFPFNLDEDLKEKEEEERRKK
jgi:hypothetical protein